MNNSETMNHNLATIGWGALFIWWGLVIVIDPLTFGIGAMGTGLILLGVNAARWRAGIPANRATTNVGIVAIVWGAIDHTLALDFGPSFATLLIVVGLVTIASLLLQARRPQDEQAL